MGTLTLPLTGDIYVDSNTLIYSVQSHPLYAPAIIPLWQEQANGRRVFSSQLARMETLVLPLRLQDEALVSDYRRLFQCQTVELLPITQNVLDEAARLRALHPSLKTPDALHAATALLHGCALFVTNDRGFQRVTGLPLAILDDILAAL
ncbi:MAG: PIN domain-containing protein [Armatimonadetes bacterium]|nr:PIN domain-containing protein [Armatimonadota bacterium]